MGYYRGSAYMNHDEDHRLTEVSKYLEFDFNKSSEFQDIVELAAKLCEKPVALITILGEEFNWLKVKSGTDIDVMPRDTSFCQYAIAQDDLLIIPDASEDPRFLNNPLVHENPKLRFYAGAPLVLNNGLKLGTLCLFDLKSNTLTTVQQEILAVLSRQVTFLMELEMSKQQLEKQIDVTASKNESLIKIAQLQSHQIRQPLTAIMGLINLVKGDHHAIDEDWLTMFETATNNFDKTISNIVAESIAVKDLRVIRFKKMVAEIDDYAILLLDEFGNIENWNRGAEKIKGYKTNEIVGKNFSVFYTADDIANKRPEKLIREAEQVGVARDEGWRVRKDGTRFWGSIVITAIHDEEMNVIGFTKVTRDLTTIKEAQDAQTVSLDMYNLIVEQTNKLNIIGGWELDLKSNAVSWTAVTKQIHDVNQDYIPELYTAINYYKEGFSRTSILEAVKMAVEQGKPWDLNLQIITANGIEKTINSVGRSNYKDGISTKVYGTLMEITNI